MNQGASTSFAFKSGAMGGIVALIFSFIVRLGGFAPFAPEMAIEKFISIIPASLEQPMVQAFGDTAGLLGLAIASIVAVLLFGAFGVLFEKVYSPWIIRYRRLTRTEQFLIYSIFPWLFFGLIIFPLSGTYFFGVNAPVLYSQYAEILSPVALLFSQLLFSLVLISIYKSAGIFESSMTQTSVLENKTQQGILSPARRVFIERSAIIVGVAILGLTSIGSLLSSAATSLSASGSRAGSSYELSQAPPVFQDKRLSSLVDSEITSNDNFYRVAIDLFDPSVNPNTWNLQVSGSSNSKSYTLDDLKSLPNVSQYTTFECVSNLVNGNLISNAKWTGIKISDLLSNAGLSTSGVQYVVFYSVDGYSVGIPLSRALMSDSILAYQMNDADLPQKHGYPLRAVIPGLYGMMSGKWVTKIALVDSFYNGYWQTRGYTATATINTLAFIIVPGDGSTASISQNNGSVLLGGYAFAGDRGISKVEVSFDQGQTWQAATLKNPISNLTWTLWAFNWFPAKTGSYLVYARATDGNGQVQTAAQTSPYPNGATGYAMITINVTS
ncbi:MAG: molybdopterin-dependent oxidoreductase [archaeon]|nr:molybdopterin-dependent oxidoreductase [archaeon]